MESLCLTAVWLWMFKYKGVKQADKGKVNWVQQSLPKENNYM